MKLICILVLCLGLSACISRLSRPLMSGIVTDSNGQALKAVQVGETQTDAMGNFSLKERRYYAFLLKEILYMEAPPVFISEIVILNGYQSCKIESYSPRGGGQVKGATWSVGQIVLYPLSRSSELKPPESCVLKIQ